MAQASGGNVPQMSEAIIIQLIVTLGVILVPGIPAYFAFKSKLVEIADDAREARVQVKNSHTTNLREEGDERHEEIMGKLDSLAETQTEHGRNIRGVRQEIGLLHEADRQVRRELSDHLDQTAENMALVRRIAAGN